MYPYKNLSINHLYSSVNVLYPFLPLSKPTTLFYKHSVPSPPHHSPINLYPSLNLLYSLLTICTHCNPNINPAIHLCEAPVIIYTHITPPNPPSTLLYIYIYIYIYIYTMPLSKPLSSSFNSLYYLNSSVKPLYPLNTLL